MADVKWIKITPGMFEDEKIRLIDAMPERDAILVCWVRLLCLAGSCNEGGSLYVTEDMPYTDEMLSTLFSRPISVVRLALATFEKLRMIQINDDAIEITNWSKHQNMDALEKMREDNRLRQQRFRAKQKAIEAPNATVTLHHALDLELEEERRKKKEEKKREYAPALHLTEVEHGKLVSRYGEKATQELIESVSNWKKAKGKSYKSDYHGILNWAKRDGLDEKRAPSAYVDPLAAERRAKAEGRLEDM